MPILKPSDWLRNHPYDNYIEKYDGFFLNMARETAALLKPVMLDVLDEKQCNELALDLACWFEDEVYGFGLWDTLRQTNLDLYGVSVPFYDLDDYDEEVLNVQDVQFLLWLKTAEMSGHWIAPDNPIMEGLARDFLAMCEVSLEHLPTGNTRFFSRITLANNTPFESVRTAMFRFATSNYLTGLNYTGEVLEAITEAQQDEDPMPPDLLHPAIEHDVVFRNTKPFYGVPLHTWFLSVVPCPPEVEQAIRDTMENLTGMFMYEGRSEGNHYLLRHPMTERLFEVDKSSMSFQGLQVGNAISCGLVFWKQRFWASGWAMLDQRSTLTALRKHYILTPKSVDWYAWTLEARKIHFQRTKFFVDVFHKTYGPLPVVMPNQKSVTALLQDFFTQVEGLPMEKGVKAVKRYEPPAGLPLENDGLAVCAWPGRGLFYSVVVASALMLLQREDLKETERKRLVELLTEVDSVPLRDALLAQFPDMDLSFAVGDSGIDGRRWIDLLARVMAPDVYAEVFPNVYL